MITVCARWESAQMPIQHEWQLWRQIRSAFQIDRLHMVPVIPEFERGNLFQYNTMKEALAAAEGERVFLEAKGTKGMSELPEGDIVIVLGDTFNNNLALAGEGETYRIETDVNTALYGCTAAAIALAIRRGQT